MLTIKQAIKQIRKEKRPFTWEENHQSEAVNTYLRYYQLDFPVQHHSGYVAGGNAALFVQSFRPPQSKGICLALHGYYDHSGCLSSLIKFLMKKQIHVITYDLQGHGLSDGDRAVIFDFADYVKDVAIIYNTFIQGTTQPRYCVAHSTGAANVLSFQQKYPNVFEKTVLVAPLIRSNLWYPSKFAYKMMNPFVSELNRTHKNSTSNERYNRFTKQDPLQYRKVPTPWVGALYRWFADNNKQLTSEKAMLVLQGNKDTTVDWRYNMSYLSEHYPNSKIILIDEAKHQLLNEKMIIRERIFDFIETYLDVKNQ